MGIYYTKNGENTNSVVKFEQCLTGFSRCHHWGQFSDFLHDDRKLFRSFSLGFFCYCLVWPLVIPIVALMVLPKLQEMNDSMIDAARDLGANNLQVIKNIILPFLTPGVIAGYFMAFTYSLDDFAVTFFVTGNGFSLLSVEIYSRARQRSTPRNQCLEHIGLLFSMILVVGYYFISKENVSKN